MTTQEIYDMQEEAQTRISKLLDMAVSMLEMAQDEAKGAGLLDEPERFQEYIVSKCPWLNS